MKLLISLGQYFIMLSSVFRFPEKRSVFRKSFMVEVQKIGVGSIPLVALMSVFGAGAQYAAGMTGTGGGLNGLSLIAASIGQQIGQTGTQLVQKTMNIQPTIKIEQGTKFKILVDHGIVFASPYQFHQPLKFVYHDSTGEQNV